MAGEAESGRDRDEVRQELHAAQRQFNTVGGTRGRGVGGGRGGSVSLGSALTSASQPQLHQTVLLSQAGECAIYQSSIEYIKISISVFKCKKKKSYLNFFQFADLEF